MMKVRSLRVFCWCFLERKIGSEGDDGAAEGSKKRRECVRVFLIS